MSVKGWAYIPLYGKDDQVVDSAIVDLVDYPDLCKIRWRCSHQGRNTYAVVHFHDGRKTTTIPMHALLMGTIGVGPETEAMTADHINRNGLDNRRINLRRISRNANKQNRRSALGSSSQFRGVSLRRSRWRAQAKLNGKSYQIGTFSSEVDAAQAIAAWRKVHMPYSIEMDVAS